MNLDLQFTAEDVWRVQLEDCRNARVSIDLENYIFTDTKIGQEFLDVFKTKAKEGVRVRMLLDMYGCSGLYYDPNRLSEIDFWGVKIAFFNTITHWRVRDITHWLSRRDHRKFLIVDGKIAHVGSACIDERMRNWQEASARIETESDGNQMFALLNSFNRLWQSATRGVLSRKAAETALAPGLSYISATPYIGNRKIHTSLLKEIRRARTSIKLASPYYVPTARMQLALFRALKKGVRVTLVIPRYSSPGIIDYANYEYARSLIRRGARVLIMPTMLHAKYYIVDDTWAMVGSANVDNLSMLHDYEHVLTGTRAELLTPLVKNYDLLAKLATPADEKFLHPGMKDKFFGLLTRPIHRFL